MTSKALSFVIARRYDTRFLLDGVVRVKDHDIEFKEIGPAPFPAFRDMVNDLSYDVAEQAMSHYVIARDMGKALTAIPVFPSRFFPQMGVTINTASGIREPGDLAGKRVGVSGFGYNPAAWIRGILMHQYDVSVEQIVWIEDEEDPFFGGLPYPRSRRFKVERARELPKLLEAGEIDAIIPPGGGRGFSDRIRRLWADPLAEIRAYYRRTGVYPINTVITMKTEVARAYPELPGRLMEAFTEARRLYHEQVDSGIETDHMGINANELKRLGVFPDAYGMEPGHRALQMMNVYCYEQGLVRTLFEPEDLFTTT